MLLKKIFYGHTRVRYIMVSKGETDSEVCLNFCRWRPLGPKAGEYSWKQYSNHTYVRKNPYETLERLNRITKARIWWGHDGTCHVTFYSPEIKQILFRFILDNLWILWLGYLILAYYYGK